MASSHLVATGASATAGVLAGALLMLAWAPQSPAPAALEPPPAAPAAAPAGPDLAALQATTARLADAVHRLEDTVERLARERPPAPAPTRPVATDAAATPGPPLQPGERRPGQLVDWLPPEGVPLVVRWYERKLSDWVRTYGEMAQKPRKYLKRVEEEDQIGDAARKWANCAERFQQQLNELRRVTTELELARWLDQTGHGKLNRPKPYELAEFARALGSGG